MEKLISYYNSHKYKPNTNSNEYKDILSLTSFIDNHYTIIPLAQRAWHIINNDLSLVSCIVCGKATKWNKNQYKYNITCSKQCSYDYRLSDYHKEKVKQTCLERYGNENYMKTNDYRQKCLIKYGVDNHAKSDIVKEKSKHNINNKSIEEKLKNELKIRKTCLERYGVEYYQQTDEFKKRYKQTCLERYGVDDFSKTEIFSLMMSNSKNIIDDKRELTCLERYGVINKSCLSGTITKVHETMKRNNSYGKSNKENEVYYFLIEQFGISDIIRQYQDERYNNKETGNLFACDFYIKSLDLFIEYDGFFSHKPQYISENKKEKLLEKWKEKSNNSEYYANILNEYKRDCLKREIAKDNNLNIIFSNSISIIKEII